MEVHFAHSTKSHHRLLPVIKNIRSADVSCQSSAKKPIKNLQVRNSLSKSVNMKDKKMAELLHNSSISNILKTVRSDYVLSNQKISQMGFLKLTDHNKKIRKQQKKIKLQKKVSSPSTFSPLHPQPNHQHQLNQETLSHSNETSDKKVVTTEISIQNKPPHRYKTQMIASQNSLILFGGIGCQKNLTWAKLSFNPQKLQLPTKQSQKDLLTSNIPYYGHTMTQYKQNAYIYGGVNADALHELFILNLKTLKLKSGPSAPYRRKYHAATMVGKYMLVYGGIEDNQTKNTIFYYDTESNEWTTLINPNLPCLSNHSMVAINTKSKRKVQSITEALDQVYVFGGKNEKGEASNKLYKLKIIEQNRVIFDEVSITESSSPIPAQRYNCCFEYMQNGNILLYGGKNDSEQTSVDVKNGTFRDVYTFNINNRTWKKHETEMDYRHSMAAASVKGRLYIYGGFGDTQYADGNMRIMKMVSSSAGISSRDVDEFCSRQNILSMESLKRIGDF